MIVAIAVSGAAGAANPGGDPDNLNKILMAFTIAGMIGTAFVTEADKRYPESSNPLLLRKYSDKTRAILNWLVRALRETQPQGAVFLALQRDTGLESRTGGEVSCPPTADQSMVIQSAYRLNPTPGRIDNPADAFVDVKITRPQWFGLEIRSGPPGVDPGITEVLITRPLIKVGEYSYLYFGPWAFGIEAHDLCSPGA